MGQTAVMTSDPAKVVSRSTIVPAPAQMIFDLLADPRRHNEIDGSGSVQSAQINAPERLSLNATFGMQMKSAFPTKSQTQLLSLKKARQLGGAISAGTSGVTSSNQLMAVLKSPNNSNVISQSRRSS